MACSPVRPDIARPHCAVAAAQPQRALLYEGAPLSREAVAQQSRTYEQAARRPARPL